MVRFSYVLVVLFLGIILESTAQEKEISSQENGTAIIPEALTKKTRFAATEIFGNPRKKLLISGYISSLRSNPEAENPVIVYLPAFFKSETHSYLYSKRMEHDRSSGFHLDDLKYRLFQVPTTMSVALASNERQSDTQAPQG